MEHRPTRQRLSSTVGRSGAVDASLGLASVCAGATIAEVVAVLADEQVVSSKAAQGVVTERAAKNVADVVADEEIVASAALHVLEAAGEVEFALLAVVGQEVQPDDDPG